MNYDSSPFINLPYEPLARYIARAGKFVDDKSNAADVRDKERFSLTEATSVLCERMERAKLGMREAWSKLMGLPVKVSNLRGTITGIVDHTLPSVSAVKYSLQIHLDDTDSDINIPFEEFQSIIFDRARMPKLQYAPEKA